MKSRNLCTAKDCKKICHGNGLCHVHYQREARRNRKLQCPDCRATDFFLKSLNSRKTLILNRIVVKQNEDPTLEEINCCNKSKKVDHPLGFHCRNCHRTYCAFCDHFRNDKNKLCCTYKCWIRCGCKSCK